MPIASGQKITPGRINVQRASAVLSSNYTLTGTMTDLAGATVSITTAYANATFYATWNGDFALVTAGSLTGVVQLVVDGVAVSQPQAIWNPANVALGQRETEGSSTSGVLSAAGLHTFKIQGSATIISGSARLNSGHTGLTILVFP